MVDPTPSVVVLAGPNGAGKSTSARAIVCKALGVDEFVNADILAQGLSGFEPGRAAMAAGRIMLARLRELARQRRSFAFETTLASRSFAPRIAEWIATGYRFHLVFLGLPDPGMAVARVAARVEEGGHHVPEETIRPRFEAGLRHFDRLYRRMATAWGFWDNSTESGLVPIASGEGTPAGPRASPSSWRDATAIEQAQRRAISEAIDRKRRLGDPAVIWREGKVVWIPAGEIGRSS